MRCAPWEELYKKRIDWVFQARDTFVEKIDDPTIRALFGKSNTTVVTVSVYGETGVGKTTLILELLGAREEVFTELADALRGKIKDGGPGTTTAIIYRISDDDFFHIKEPNSAEEILKTRKDMQRRLAELRKRVQSAEYQSEETVQIAIAKSYFPPGAATESWTIIDLPGTGSAEQSEHRHVDRVLNAFVLYSNLIILVLNAEKIASLENEVRFPDGNSWRLFREKCRIVLTHTASKKSVLHKIKERMRSPSAISLDEWFQDAAGELSPRHTQCDFPAKHVFPLEYGHSWNHFKEKYPDASSQLAPHFELLKSRLKEQIGAASDASQAILQYTRMAGTVETLITTKCEEMTQMILVAAERACVATKKYSEVKTKTQKMRELEMQSEKRKADFLQTVPRSSLKLQLDSCPSMRSDDYHRDALDSYVTRHKERLMAQVRSHVEQFTDRPKYFRMNLDSDELIADRNHNGLSRHWTKYAEGKIPHGQYKDWGTWWDRVWGQIPDRDEWWKQHCAAASKCVEKIRHSLSDYVTEKLERAWDSCHEELAEEANGFHILYHEGKSLVHVARKQGIAAKREETQRRKELERYTKMTSMDLEAVKKYRVHLIESFGNNIREEMATINSSPESATINILRALNIQMKVNWVRGALETT
jgi:hypothetical protein